jgi:hypothetical protein
MAFTKVLTIYQIYHIGIHPLHNSPLFPPSPIPGMVSTGIIFAFTYMYTYFLHYIHTSNHFPHHHSSPNGINPSQAGSLFIYMI